MTAQLIESDIKEDFLEKLNKAIKGGGKTIDFQVVSNPHFGASRFVVPGNFTGPLIYIALIN